MNVVNPLVQITYLWNKLHPDREPVQVDVQVTVDPPAIIPIRTKDAVPTQAELQGYLMTERNMTIAEIDRLMLPDIVEILRREVESKSGKSECHVTLQQMASIVNKSKRHLERVKTKLPPPTVKGGSGKADEWAWSDVRPILNEIFGRQLPEVFPADRFVRQ